MNLLRIRAALMMAASLLAFTVASGQVVVYSIDFKHQSGFNMDFFDGGYFVAPALGGAGTFVLTSKDDGIRKISVASGSGNFFTAYDSKGKRFTVVNAGNSGSSTGTTAASNVISSFLAFGEVDGTVEINTTDAVIKLRVAKEMKGTAIASGDESGATSADPDTGDDDSTDSTDSTTTTSTAAGTTFSTTSISKRNVGFADISDMKLTFDKGYTEKANDAELGVSATAAALVTALKQRGYVEEGDGTTADPEATATSGN